MGSSSHLISQPSEVYGQFSKKKTTYKINFTTQFYPTWHRYGSFNNDVCFTSAISGISVPFFVSILSDTVRIKHNVLRDRNKLRNRRRLLLLIAHLRLLGSLSDRWRLSVWHVAGVNKTRLTPDACKNVFLFS